MDFSDHLASLVRAVDDHLGESAIWGDGTNPVRVHPREQDESASYGRSDLLMRTRTVEVHESQVPRPGNGDSIVMLRTAEVLVVTGDPVRDLDGYWTCTVRPIDAV